MNAVTPIRALIESLVTPAKLRTTHVGFIAAVIRRACKGDDVTVGYPSPNDASYGMFGIYHAPVRLNGDDTDYRLILCPADAPICVNGVAIEQLIPVTEAAA